LNLLLDTCALVALARGSLPVRASAALKRAPEARVPAVCAWEVAIKVAAHKLVLREPPLQWFLGLVERYDLREVPLDSAVACSAAMLPPVHRDPFDRVIVAIAHAQSLTVLTSDENIPKYPGVRTVW
jgi:PIN domain nuclease of toxin-antitoxin system